MLVIAGDSVRPFKKNNIKVCKTLSFGKLKIPYRILGARRMCVLHDWLVAKQLPMLHDKIDIIHVWPLAALRTMRVAKKLNIPVALERCNAHTRFAYKVVNGECERIGVPLPANHEHTYNSKILELEEREYQAADGILCPSDFVVKTFLDEGFAKDKLFRFIYGVDENVFYPSYNRDTKEGPLKMIYVGVAAVRKGLHYALEAWLQSTASQKGKFLIVGGFIPEYEKKLAPFLNHSSIEVLGHRNDVAELMRECDLFILPSIEEGFGLVCTEAMASGCVPLVSDACTDLCKHMNNSLVHSVGDVDMITYHINLLQRDRELLQKLKSQGIQSVPSLTWSAAGHSIMNAYKKIITLHQKKTEQSILSNNISK